jgi:cold-inducible RNA-binding protein
MGNRLYIGNVSNKATEEDLQTLFTEAGQVVTVLIGRDHQTGARKNYAFVLMETDEMAQAAVQMMNGHMLHNRAIKVTEIQAPVKSDVRHSETGGFRQQKRGGWRNDGHAR